MTAPATVRYPPHTPLSPPVLECTFLPELEGKVYRLHDLAREGARGRLARDGRWDKVARRHARHYLGLREARERYEKGHEGVLEGLALFDRDRGEIEAGQVWAAARAGEDREAAELCVRYPNAGAYVLELRLHPRELIRWREAGLEAARAREDRNAEGVHLRNLGNAYANLGETRKAIGYYEQHLAIAREVGDRRGEGRALGSWSVTLENQGDRAGAIALSAVSRLEEIEPLEDLELSLLPHLVSGLGVD